MRLKGVLVVDDVDFMRKTLKEALARHGIPVCGEAGNGQEALDAYRACRPGVVLLDLLMPVMDGFGFLEAVRREDPAAKVIVCSAAVKREMVMRALRLGAADFIAKPVDEERLVQSIRRLLAV